MSQIMSPTTPDAYQLRGPVDAMRWLVIHFGHLPAPYMSVQAYSTRPSELTVQVQDPAHFEMWREALELDAEDVQLRTNGVLSWLEAEGQVRFEGVRSAAVRLLGHGLPLVAVREAEQVAS